MDLVTPLPEDAGPLIQGHGTAEAQWARCRWLQRMGTLSLAALLMDRRRLVIVAPHPDDEVLGCGGLMWMARHAGIDVLVVSVSNGEACYPDAAPADMGATRQAELLAAMDALGVPAAKVVGLAFADGTLTDCEDRLHDALAAVVTGRDLVVATWEHDGHPDHEATGRAARRAASSGGARYASYPVWAWHWLDVRDAPRRLGGAARLALATDGMAAKRAAIERFESQLRPPAPTAPILPPHVVERFQRPFEVFLP